MTVPFSVTFDADRLKAGLGRLADKIVPYMKTTWMKIAEFTLREVKASTPQTRTGTDIKGMWAMERQEFGAVTEFIIHNLYPDPQVVVWFEEGTQAHIIPIGEAGFLHFFTYEGAEVYTKKPVHHPGTPAWKMAEQGRVMAEILLNQYVHDTYSMVDRLLEGGL